MSLEGLQKFLSVEMLIFAIGSFAAGFIAYGDLKAQDAALGAKIEQQEKQRDQQYSDLREGQKELRRLMRELLKENGHTVR